MKAAIYLRVSTEEQANSGLGLEAQLAACENAARKFGFEEFQVFTDAGISGSVTIAKRPGLSAALATLRKGDALIIAKRDRLSRTMSISIAVEDLLKTRKAILLSANGEGSGTGAEDVSSLMQRRMFQVFAEIERGMIRDRTRSALQAKKVKGERVGAIPFGFALSCDDQKHLVLNEREQEIIATVKALRAKGLAQRKIVSFLNEHSISTRSGNGWTKTQITRILSK